MIDRVPRLNPVEPLVRGDLVAPTLGPVAEAAVRPTSDPLARAAAERVWPSLIATMPGEARQLGSQSSGGERPGVDPAGALAGSQLVEPARADRVVTPTMPTTPAAVGESLRLSRPDRRVFAGWGQGVAAPALPAPVRPSEPIVRLSVTHSAPAGSPLVPDAAHWPALAPRLAAAQDAGMATGLPTR